MTTYDPSLDPFSAPDPKIGSDGRPRDEKGRYTKYKTGQTGAQKTTPSPPPESQPKGQKPDATTALVFAEMAEVFVQAAAATRKVEKNVRSRKLTWMDVIGLWTFYLIVISIGPIKQADVWLDYHMASILNSPAAKMLGIKTKQDNAFTAEIGKGEQPMKAGEVVGGYEVTSPRGRRNIGDGNEFHHGVDFATPIGTPLYLPETAQVKCWFDDGGGNVAEFDYAGYLHKFLHLSECTPGVVAEGAVFAKTGHTGRSTGPHLDYRMKKRGQWKEPSRKMMTAVFTGEPLIYAESSFTEKYKAAIAKQESRHYTDVNPHTGAMGKYQFMPDASDGSAGTATLMAEKCGLDYDDGNRAAFLQNEALQESMMDCYVDSFEVSGGEYQRCRMLASAHYSGDPKLYNSKKPQYSAGVEYPSIYEYTKSVCSSFK